MDAATTERAPYVFDAVPCNAVHACAGTLRHHWGESGYSIVTTRYRAVLDGDLYYVFGCRHSDGSEWYLCADRWENVRHADWDGEQFTVGERVYVPYAEAVYVDAAPIGETIAAGV